MKTEVKLNNLSEFQSILEGYKPSSDSLDILSQTKLVLLVGPTAAGRNTLIKLLVESGRYHFLVSSTTRPKRSNNGVLEQDGVEYWFKTEEDFLKGLKEGEFLEAAIIHGQQVSGISVAELSRAKNSGKIAIDEIEIIGANVLNGYKPDALIVFLVPPAFDIWMDRLRGRGHMPEDELIRRLKSAQEEFAAALEANFYQFVINDEVHEAATAVDELANGRQIDVDKQQRGRDHTEQLLIDIQLYLKNVHP